jgi:hypothetical protein
LTAFAVSNRTSVALGLWPLPFTVEAPLYLFAFAGLLLGFVIGELHARIGRHRLKREMRRCAREIEALRRELAATQAQFGGTAVPSRPAVPLRD